MSARSSPPKATRIDTPTAMIAAACAVVLIVLARAEVWTADDAFISFRYVDNFLGGLGLTYNSGERVEGFSSFLFLLLLVPAKLIGIRQVVAANAIGIACATIELWLLVRLARRTTGSAWAALIGGVLFATDRIVSVWATGGLETSMHGALLFAAFSLPLSEGRDRAIVPASIVHALLVASRPEGLAFYPVYLVLLMRASSTDAGASWRSSLRRSLNVFLPLVAVLFAARYAYYGAVVANPYRAKVEGVPDTLAFGAGYVQAFAHRMGWLGGAHVLVWAALVGATIWAWRVRRSSDASHAHGVFGPLLAALLYVAVGVVVVVPMGGDYLSDFRFLRPVVGIIAFAVAYTIALVMGWPGGLRSLAGEGADRRLRIAGVAIAIAFLVSHGLRQREGNAIFWDVTPAREHKRSLEVMEDDARRFRTSLFQFAEPGDSLLSDKSGYMGIGHTLRTIDATGLLSHDIARDFYLRPEWSEGGPRERFPGHARWPKVDFMQRERITIIFPKINRRPPTDAEIGPRSPRRHREYPFLHVTVPLESGEFLRFFSTLSPAELEARATRRGIAICWRAPQGPLACAGTPRR